MKQTNVIELRQCRTEHQGFDYAAYARRAEKRLRCSQLRNMMVAAAETVSTALIGVCFTVCTVLVFTML